MFLEKKDRPTRFFSKRQEDAVAKSLGGARQLNSGAGNMGKGDVIAHDWVIECKTKVTPSETISMHKNWFESVEADRQAEAKSYEYYGRDPDTKEVISYWSIASIVPLPSITWVILPVSTFAGDN